ncbi:gliding motility-associated C-terminal domain-containing protein [Puia sp.]|jgi:gliding motility-associated-like protein|uniref:T9SS type B sorting domain-containing protein n=1 Tax=Puia sp. TaxID=2045100 RepID=UPI002F40D9C9
MKTFLPVCWLLIISISGLSQAQVCPLNSNYSFGNLTHWAAYTGNNAGGNGPSAIKQRYDSTVGAPTGTVGTSTIYEYNLPSVAGIQILSNSTKDLYGGFATIPTINGYKYTNSILLGSTSITRSSSAGSGGGYVRGVSMQINVPPGAPGEPYTMTYAYAMVLENGTHNSNDQPLFSATLAIGGNVVECASPRYFLPTFNNANPRNANATLDSALAKSQGFYLSSHASPNANPNGQGAGASEHLYDVWAKDWTEVTFDLGPYRGQLVTLTFETDNCVPGGHFAYSYLALRNTCGGLQISGPQSACIGSTLIYSVPALAGASYQWQVPPGWSVVSGADSNILKVLVTDNGGTVTAQEANSCATLNASLDVVPVPPTIAGAVGSDNEVCSGNNDTKLTLAGNRGSVLNWLSTTDGVNYTSIPNTTPNLDALNLTATTTYVAVVQNGESCSIDTATAAKVLVDPQTVGGSLSPASMQFCIGQNKDALLTLTGEVGTPVNWQSSPDGTSWTDLAPPVVDSIYELLNLTSDIQYRVVVKSGVCPAQNSDPAVINVVSTPFPQATAEPADTLICYNTKATLNATISIGTNYSWTNASTLTNQGNGNVPSLPFILQATASPLSTTNYVLSIENAGCPNLLKDTFHVRVLPPIIVDAGHDTSVVINQPVQLYASSNDTTTPGGDGWQWTPSIGLDNPNIANPIGIYTPETDSVRYLVTATSQYGCTGSAEVLVVIFKTGPNIFVPNAFTPGGPTNNIFRPIPVGISTLQYFRIFNRWGQLVYSTTQIGQGWDGRLNGQPLPSGSYVWMVQGISYTKRTIFHKGVMVLVR